MWEGVEISFHIPSLHECQKCKMSGRQEKGHHDDWCNIGNQITKNPNNHYPQKPSSNNASDEKNDDETTSDKFCNGNENEEDKNVGAPPSGVLIDEAKTNSAATPSEEKHVPFCQMAQRNLPTKHETERKGLNSKKVLERRVRIFWNTYF